VAALYQPKDFLYFLTYDRTYLIPRTYAWRFLINRAHYITTNFSFAENIFYEDWYTPLIFLQTAMVYTPYDAYGYRKRSDSISQNKPSIMTSRILDSMIFHYTIFLPKLLQNMNLENNDLAQRLIHIQLMTHLAFDLPAYYMRSRKSFQLQEYLEKENLLKKYISISHLNDFKQEYSSADALQKIDFYIRYHFCAPSIKTITKIYMRKIRIQFIKKMIKMMLPYGFFRIYQKIKNKQSDI
jgi:hypothetical protein